MTQRFRNVCFTINNPTDDDWDKLEALPYSYLIMGLEGEGKTEHIQGYAELDMQLRMKSLKVYLPRAHIEERRGTAEQARDYCKKEGNWEEDGEMKCQGERTDLVNIKDAVLGGASMKSIMPSIVNYQQLKFTETLMKYSLVNRPIECTLNVHWLWGKPGSGKTTKAFELLKDKEFYMWTKTQGKWWDGYDYEKYILMDDLREGDFEYTELLNILGRGPCRVQVKGGSKQLMAVNFIITSVKPPTKFKWVGEDHRQLMRRITKIEEIVGSEVNGNTMETSFHDGIDQEDSEKAELLRKLRRE